MKTTPLPDWVLTPFKINNKEYRLSSTKTESPYRNNNTTTFDEFYCLTDKKYYKASRVKWLQSLKKLGLIQ